MKSHRGLSAIVGTVFLVAVVIGALSYISYSLDIMGNFSESLIAEESRQKDKQSEAFQIESIDVTAANKLDGVIKNTGEIPVEITTLWIDEEGVNDVVQKFDLDAEIAPGNTLDISSLVDFTMDPAKGYNMKVVSSRGEVNSFYVNSLANENIYMTLTPSSTIIPSTFQATLSFTVINNMSNGNYLYNLTPIMNDTKQSLSEGSTGLILDQISGPVPATYDSLGPGEVAVFTYVYELTSETDLDANLFNVTLANANPGNEALTRVSVKSVPLASEAGSALTSLGLTEAASSLADVLYFHIPNGLTPAGEYPMDGASPNSAGMTKSPNGNTLKFISSGITSGTTLPIGAFTTSLNYFSSPVPLGFPTPSFIFTMDEKDNGANDEISDMLRLFDPDQGFREGGNLPEFSLDGGPEVPNGGPDGDQYFHLDDGDYFYDDWDVNGGFEDDYTQPGAHPDTTAIWIKMEPNTKSQIPLVVWGDGTPASAGDVHEDTYGFWMINSGYIRYGWTTEHNHSEISSVYCDSSAASASKYYDDDQWHHVVGVRNGEHSCLLYIDGQLVTTRTETRNGDDLVEVDTLRIGSDIYENEFGGDIASIIHWNANTLTAAQVTDLYYTNYGNNATRLYMKVERVDAAGTTVLQTIVPETKISLPFFDPSIGNTNAQANPWIGFYTANTTDAKYTTKNMTASSTSVITFAIGERIKLTLDWKGENQQNLPINIMFDDSTGWTLPLGPSYIQTPVPTPRWPTYLSFPFNENLRYYAYNEGPEGIWFTFPGTRFVLTSLDGVKSYAAMPKYVNFTTAPSPATTNAVISGTRDSLYIGANMTAELDFWMIQAPPSAQDSPCTSCKVTTGDYDAALYLSGYDEDGETFLRTINMGLVHITGNP